MPLDGAEILSYSLVQPINIHLINTFCPECSILVIIGIIRCLSKLYMRKVILFLEISSGTRRIICKGSKGMFR